MKQLAPQDANQARNKSREHDGVKAHNVHGVTVIEKATEGKVNNWLQKQAVIVAKAARETRLRRLHDASEARDIGALRSVIDECAANGFGGPQLEEAMRVLAEEEALKRLDEALKSGDRSAVQAAADAASEPGLTDEVYLDVQRKLTAERISENAVEKGGIERLNTALQAGENARLPESSLLKVRRQQEGLRDMGNALDKRGIERYRRASVHKVPVDGLAPVHKVPCGLVETLCGSCACQCAAHEAWQIIAARWKGGTTNCMVLNPRA
jgi:hypothetical protein